MSRELLIRPATRSDLDIARSWLLDAGLPVADLTLDHMQNFLVAVADGTPAGMIGLEQFGGVGLLRSLLVDPSTRSGGIGAALVVALESMATALGVVELWLLTIDADAYFSQLGYIAVERTDAPTSIRSTKEFSELCPGDATLMKKVL